MPVLCIRRANVSSWALVAYVCFRPMFNPESLLHRQRSEICSRGRTGATPHCLYRFRTLAGQAGQLRENGAVRCQLLVSGMAVIAEMQNKGDPRVRAKVVAVIEHVLGSD